MMRDGKARVVIPRVMILMTAALVAAATVNADDPMATHGRQQKLTDGTERVEMRSDLGGAPSSGAAVSAAVPGIGSLSWEDTGPSSAGLNRYMIPAAAHASGLEGTQWVTDVVIHNPGDSTATVNVFFLRGGGNNDEAEGLQYLCDESTSMLASDIVLSAFGESSATGGILVGSENPLLVSSRTYNTAESGTYGQYVPGLAKDLAIGPNDDVRLIQLTRTTDYRTNIGFSNDTDQMLTVRVASYRAGGDLISNQSYDLQPYGYSQATDIIGTNVPDAYAVVSSTTPDASYFAYASVVDNNSGDPVLVLPSGSAGQGEVVYVPAAAHATGIGGTNWRTDLEIHNPGGFDANFRVELLERNRENSSPTALTFNLGGGESRRYEDTLQEIFGFEGTGALRVTPTSGEIIATSRTYNDVPSGTYGQFIPGVAHASAIAEGQTGRLIQLSYSSSDTSGFRTNIGFVNTTGSTATASVELYTGDGELLGTRSHTLKPYEYDQVSNIFSAVTEEDVEDGFAIVSSTTAGGRFFAYASVVDNRSGDPVYIPAAVEGDAPSLPPDEITVTLPGGVPLVMVPIPAGTFMMGSPTDESGRGDNEDLHQVTLTRDYYMGKYEITQAQWRAVMGSNPASGSGEGDDYPVYNVSWEDIAGPDGFIERLNQQLGTSAFRLPTEAEWERAARAGTQTRFSYGDADGCDNLCGFCDLHDSYMVWCGNNMGRTAETGSRLPNAYDLHNVHGNVMEWVQDRYTELLGTDPRTDPTGPTSGWNRVLCGGCWLGLAQNNRSATRRYGWPSYQSDVIGFRLAASGEIGGG